MATETASAGLEIRKQVLGDEYVAAAAQRADEFTEPLQEFLNENCWGLAWTRPGIDLRMRSTVTLTVLAVTGKSHELAAHVRGAIRNGLTMEEIREIFLQISVYAGVPTAVEAFRVAQPVIAEMVGTGGKTTE
jgi:alkylhydroperoxidase/carboxymuconolactone decarboxylase family protein YurZ